MSDLKVNQNRVLKMSARAALLCVKTHDDVIVGMCTFLILSDSRNLALCSEVTLLTLGSE